MDTNIRNCATAGLLALALSACGGGSRGENQGGGAPSGQTLARAFGIYALSGSGGPEEVIVATGAGSGDGTTFTATTTDNDHASVSSGNVSASPYTVGADGALAFTAGALAGGVNADGLGFVTSTTSDGESPGILVGLRKEGSGFSAASLSGAYHLVAFQQLLPSNSTTAAYGSTTFDGAGGAMSTDEFVTIDGVLAAPSAFSTTYTVQPTGDFSDSQSLAGHVMAGNDVVMAAGSIMNGEAPYLTVYLKEQAAATNESFQGNYWAVQFSSNPGADTFSSLVGTLSADGAGAGTISGTRNNNGTISPLGTAGLTYAVGPNGRVDATINGIGVVGALSPDGRIVVLVGSTMAVNPPEIWMLIRK